MADVVVSVPPPTHPPATRHRAGFPGRDDRGGRDPARLLRGCRFGCTRFGPSGSDPADDAFPFSEPEPPDEPDTPEADAPAPPGAPFSSPGVPFPRFARRSSRAFSAGDPGAGIRRIT
jgi:hypothetical protein